MPDNRPTLLDLFSGIPSGDFHWHSRPKVSEPSASLKSTHTPAPSCASTGQAFQTTETCELFGLDAMSFPPASRANRFPLQDEDSERQTIATSGRHCLQLSTASGRLSCLEKTLLESKAWFSPNASMAWRPLAIGRGHLMFRLALLDYLPWNGTSGLLPRILTMDYKGAPRKAFRGNKYPSCSGGRFVQALRSALNDPIYPNPDFCEAVKGFPITWSALSESETRLTHKSRKSSRGPSTNS